MNLLIELERVLSVIEDKEYIEADLMMISLFSVVNQSNTGLALFYALRKAHESIKYGTYTDMVVSLETAIDMLRVPC